MICHIGDNGATSLHCVLPHELLDSRLYRMAYHTVDRFCQQHPPGRHASSGWHLDHLSPLLGGCLESGLE
jgi:hypothetical protein